MPILNLIIGVSCTFLGFKYENYVVSVFGILNLVIAFILATNQ